jgi:hypothetical protein
MKGGAVMNSTLGELLESAVQPNAEQFEQLGREIGRLYTDHGLPSTWRSTACHMNAA